MSVLPCVSSEVLERPERQPIPLQGTWVDIFECCFKAQSSKLVCLFSQKRDKRDVRALSFELLKMSPQVGLAVTAELPIEPRNRCIFDLDQDLARVRSVFVGTKDDGLEVFFPIIP